MDPDRDVIDLRIARIESCLEQLEPFAQLSDWQFTSRYESYHTAKRILAAALNTVSQIARHLQRCLDGRSVDSVEALIDLGIVEPELGARLRRALLLLDTLAKGHYEEDRDIVYDFLRSDLPDLTEFGGAVTTFLDARAG